MLREWGIFKVEYKRAFIRGDGVPMLYVKAKSSTYYVHIEGIIKEQELKCYMKLTESDKNKHSHKRILKNIPAFDHARDNLQ